MQEDLSRLREDSKWTDGSTDAKIIMIKDENDSLLSWCLMEPRFGDEDSAYSAQFYTRVSARGRGYGKRLMKRVLKIDNNPWVYPHDKRSGDFFKNYKQSVRVSTISSGWLNDDKKEDK